MFFYSYGLMIEKKNYRSVKYNEKKERKCNVKETTEIDLSLLESKCNIEIWKKKMMNSEEERSQIRRTGSIPLILIHGTCALIINDSHLDK